MSVTIKNTDSAGLFMEVLTNNSPAIDIEAGDQCYVNYDLLYTWRYNKQKSIEHNYIKEINGKLFVKCTVKSINIFDVPPVCVSFSMINSDLNIMEEEQYCSFKQVIKYIDISKVF
jgi:hypothetical protein